jgi:hypothetical protein
MSRALLVGLLLACGISTVAHGQSPPANAVTVTADNFNRAETDMYFAEFVKRGAFGKFVHVRELPVEGIGVRPNRDMLYSEAVFDLDAGPVKITLPKAGKRFMSITAINENHYVFEVAYGPGNYTYNRGEVGTRYLFVALRILANPTDPQDMKQAQALQDAVIVKQKAAGQSAWGGNPEKDILYLNVTPSKNDGTAVYKLSVPAKVPVDAFWSVTVYDANGRFQKNPYNAYSVNSLTATKSDDGSAAIQFGGCDGKIPNCLPTMKDWNYMVRLYRPRDEMLNGKWKFPQAQLAN